MKLLRVERQLSLGSRFKAEKRWMIKNKALIKISWRTALATSPRMKVDAVDTTTRKAVKNMSRVDVSSRAKPLNFSPFKERGGVCCG